MVEVTTVGGATFREHVTAVRGTAQNPMTGDEVAAKFRDLVSPQFGADRAARLVEAIWTLDRLADVRDLRSLLQSR